LAAGAYKELGATSFAIHYYERILKNYPDITVMGNSIHFMCLKELISNPVCKEYLVEYYKEIISRFGENIDIGAYYYYLAKTYEELGDWDLAMQTYKQFLTYPDTFIMGYPDAQEETRKKVAFYDVKKTWVVEDLSQLVNTIKTALSNNDVVLLNRYKAKINFFSKYWNQKEYDKSLTEKVFNIGNFLVSSRVHYRSELESESNANEAYLKTTGWCYFVSTWYFYFRRINFAADPEVDGKWEWVGIYFGEKS
jgi:tetratricopeptide (TPR) repeat protein